MTHNFEGIKMKQRTLLERILLAGLVAMLLSCSRIGVHKEKQTAVPASAPIILHPAAEALKGKKLSWLLQSAMHTVETVPLDSGMIRQVAQGVSPAVVSIYTRTTTNYRFKVLPLPTSGLKFAVDGEALGSGFFIHESGYLLTNSHVLEDATRIVAQTVNDKDFELEIVAEDRVYDLALLKVKEGSETFPVLKMGDSKDVHVGDWVIAVGNPLGLGHTVTHGIVSQTGRELVTNLKENERQIEFLQTDTPINPGSSGGPLVTLTGAWIGVNTAVIVNSQGISFCVPQIQVIEFLQNVLIGNGITV